MHLRICKNLNFYVCEWIYSCFRVRRRFNSRIRLTTGYGIKIFFFKCADRFVQIRLTPRIGHFIDPIKNVGWFRWWWHFFFSLCVWSVCLFYLNNRIHVFFFVSLLSSIILTFDLYFSRPKSFFLLSKIDKIDYYLLISID